MRLLVKEDRLSFLRARMTYNLSGWTRLPNRRPLIFLGDAAKVINKGI